MEDEDKKLLTKLDKDVSILSVEFKHTACSLHKVSENLEKIVESLESERLDARTAMELEAKMDEMWFFLMISRNPKFAVFLGLSAYVIFTGEFSALISKMFF